MDALALAIKFAKISKLDDAVKIVVGASDLWTNIEVLAKAAKDGALDELCEFIGVNLSKETVKPTYNLNKMLDEVYERYEMLTLLESVNRTWNRKENQVEKIANYINVIDVCNANNSSK